MAAEQQMPQIAFTVDGLIDAYLKEGKWNPFDFMPQPGGIGLLGPANLNVQLVDARGQPLAVVSDASAGVGVGGGGSNLATALWMEGLVLGAAGVRAIAEGYDTRGADDPLLTPEKKQTLMVVAQVARQIIAEEMRVAPFGWTYAVAKPSALSRIPGLGEFLAGVSEGRQRHRRPRIIVLEGI